MADGKAEHYEFDAPCHVVDLNELVNSENDDKWFEQRDGAADGHLFTPCRPDQLFISGDNPSAPVNQVQTDVDSGPSRSKSPPSNSVTSCSAETSAKNDTRPVMTTNQLPAQPRRVSKRNEKITTGPAAPPSKKYKRSPVAQKSRSDQLELGTAHEPHPATTSSANIQQSTSEEQELERIRNLQEEVALHRRRNEANYKAALAGKVRPKKMVLPTTVPKDFNFSTDKRAQASTSSNTSHKVVDFIDQLRKPSSPAKARKGATVPKPFNLSTGKKRKLGESDGYVPMAQQVEQFQKRTPTRYHLRSRRSQERGPPREKSNLKLTQPHPPHLVTQQRSRPLTVKSSADLEAEELEKLQNFKLKALELNKKILESAEDLKKPAVKEPTVPECFQLETEKRLQERQATKKPQEEEPHNFKAKPLPKKILEGVLGLPEKKVADPTVPESPAFALKKRVRLVSKLQEEKQISPVKAPPVPHLGLPFQPRLPGNHHVEVCPFSFEKREQEKRALKEKRLEEKQNEEVPQFKAQPLPDFDTVVLPEKKKQEPTKPEPFRFLVDERGAVKTSRWETMVKEEQIHQEEAVIFKAKPNTVTQKEPFRPKKEDRPGVVVEAFELATERRAREWQEYEQLTVEKEALRVRMETEQRQEEEQREKEEIARLRKEQVHRAQPIRHYKPVAVKKSDTPLTVPESPNFSARFRF
ncbi:targeting protein for Xklp2 [Acanthochromis polyacanthus]|uniref:targeting protein for Xklp2 n=1 Tax=Acanthochromis polyacanthus TaxID=80966 RepID=UPI002233EE14|nr:targeting protein for Xklp2 [Acanthochromis polyacanthus]